MYFMILLYLGSQKLMICTFIYVHKINIGYLGIMIFSHEVVVLNVID